MDFFDETTSKTTSIFSKVVNLAFVRLRVREKNTGVLELARMMEAEFDELGKQITIEVRT